MENNFNELYEKMSKLQWLLQRHHLLSHAQYGPMADPTRGQGRVLAILKLQERISTKDLSYLLGIRQQSLNELLNKLEKKGYVVRVPSEEDKRIMLVMLTEKGKNEHQESGLNSESIFSCLSEEEQAAFGKYLDRIITVLESQLGAEVNDDEWDEWMCAARSRMGHEQVERLRSMRGGFFGSRFHDMWSRKLAHEPPNPNDHDPHGNWQNGFHFGEQRDKKPEDK